MSGGLQDSVRRLSGRIGPEHEELSVSKYLDK